MTTGKGEGEGKGSLFNITNTWPETQSRFRVNRQPLTSLWQTVQCPRSSLASGSVQDTFCINVVLVRGILNYRYPPPSETKGQSVQREKSSHCSIDSGKVIYTSATSWFWEEKEEGENLHIRIQTYTFTTQENNNIDETNFPVIRSYRYEAGVMNHQSVADRYPLITCGCHDRRAKPCFRSTERTL